MRSAERRVAPRFMQTDARTDGHTRTALAQTEPILGTPPVGQPELTIVAKFGSKTMPNCPWRVLHPAVD